MLRTIGVVVSCTLGVLTSACVDVGGGDEPTDVETLYQAAIGDAEHADVEEIVADLTAIRPDNNSLTYDAAGRVLMVTWTSYDGYDSLLGQDTDLGVEVWVTAGHELQDFCVTTGLVGDALALRLEQRLGLPPGDGNDRIVELWVPEAALFRPAPDAEIDDSVAQLAYPSDAAPEHITWIENLRASSYSATGYPWTRLGYTYDWSPEAESEVGPSEFVIREGSRVGVQSVSTQDDYCRTP